MKIPSHLLLVSLLLLSQNAFSGSWAVFSSDLSRMGDCIAYAGQCKTEDNKLYYWFGEGEPCDGQPNTLWDNDAGSCVAQTNTPQECAENGQLFDQATSQCTNECPEGQSMLNGTCFAPIDDTGCDENSPDFQGSIGWGADKQSVCSGQSNCGSGQVFGTVNGVGTCVNNDFGLPDCPSGQYAAVDDYGAGCNSFDQGAPNDPLPTPEPNTDTDEDGIPDEYRPENDPNSTDLAVNQTTAEVQELQNLQNEANDTADKTLSAIDKLRKDNNLRLDTLIDQTNSELPENGKLSESNLIPTLTQSTQNFSNAISSNTAVQLVSNIVVPSSSSCPTYTLPPTPISGAIVMDIHCSILSQHQGVISAMFLFAWSLLALTVFLKA